MTKKNGYQEAVDRARAREAGTELVQAPAEDQPKSLALGGDITGMLVPSTEILDELRANVASGAWEAAPQLLKISEGQTLIAFLEGNGPRAEFTDNDTGEVSENDTWILSKNGVRVSILSSAQLDRKLPPFVGGMVSITRGKDVRNGQRLYTEYLVAGPKRADGSKRDWATRPLLQAGPKADVAATPTQAAAGAEDLL